MLLQKTVSFPSIVHKCGLKAGFNMGDDRFINISMDTFFSRAFDMKFCKLGVDYFCNPAILGIYGIDKDFTAHKIFAFIVFVSNWSWTLWFEIKGLLLKGNKF